MYHATGLTGWQRSGRGYRDRAHFVPEAPEYGYYGAHRMTEEQELDSLKEHAEYLESTLGNLHKRIEELETREKQKK
jgi:hypothetical protein